MVVDCLTVWLGNWMGHIGYPEGEEIDDAAVKYSSDFDSSARGEFKLFMDKMEQEKRTVILGMYWSCIY